MKLIKNKLGQATLEYVLVLIIGVTLVTGISSQIFEPFGDFTSSVFDYQSCLFATGSLSNPHCNKPEFEERNWNPNFQEPSGTNWRINTPTNNNPSPRGPNTDYDFENPNSNSNSNISSTRFPSRNSSPAPNPSSQNKTRFQSSNFQNPNPSASSSKIFEDLSGNSNYQELSSSKKRRGKREGRGIKKSRNELNPIEKNQSRSFENKNQGLIYSSGTVPQEEEQKRKSVFQAKNSNFSKNSSKKDSTTNKKPILIEEKSEKQEEVKNTPLKFGAYIRYIVIAVLILSILFFIFSRFMEISENLKGT